MLSRLNSVFTRAKLLLGCCVFLLQGAWAAFSGSGFLAEDSLAGNSSRRFVLASSSVTHPSFASLSISSANPVNEDDHRFYYYSPHLGRQTTTDPIGKKFQAGDINLYRYVGNSTTSWIDPYGLAQLIEGAGEFISEQRWISDRELDAFNDVYALPATIDNAEMSREQMEEQMAAAEAAGDYVNENIYNRYDTEIENGANFAAGFSDGMLFGQGHNLARLVHGSDTPWADTSSGYYTGGQWTGIAATSVTGLGITRNAYRVPGTLYHFTSNAAAASIRNEGVIRAGSGLFGRGAYGSSVRSPIAARLMGAQSTQTSISFSTRGLNVRRPLIPGAFRVRGNVPLR